MGILGLTSIIIPSRNEKYLSQTIQSLLKNANETIEIIAVLDGYWCDPEEIVDDKRVVYLHYSESRGMREAITRECPIQLLRSTTFLLGSQRLQTFRSSRQMQNF